MDEQQIQSTQEDIQEFFRQNPQLLPLLQNITLRRINAELQAQIVSQNGKPKDKVGVAET